MDLIVTFDRFFAYCNAHDWCVKRWGFNHGIWFGWHGVQGYGITFGTLEHKMEFVIVYV